MRQKTEAEIWWDKFMGTRAFLISLKAPVMIVYGSTVLPLFVEEKQNG